MIFRKLFCAFIFFQAYTSCQADLMVGLGAPITGANAFFGKQLRSGAEQAVEDINQNGGVNGEKLVLVIEDDASDPKQGVAVANKFISQNIHYVVGHFDSSVSIAASNVYKSADVLQLSLSSAESLTSRKLWNVFRVYGSNKEQAKPTAEYLIHAYPNKKIAFVNDKSPYGKELMNDVVKQYKHLGGKPTYSGVITPGEKDFSTLISILKSKSVDVIYFGGYHTEAGLLMRQIGDLHNYNPELVGGDTILNNEFPSIAGNAAQYVKAVFFGIKNKDAHYRSVMEKFKQKNIIPEAYTLFAYTAVELLKGSIEATHSKDPKELAQYLHSGKAVPTVSGELKFNQKGDVLNPVFEIFAWKRSEDGTMHPVMVDQ